MILRPRRVMRQPSSRAPLLLAVAYGATLAAMTTPASPAESPSDPSQVENVIITGYRGYTATDSTVGTKSDVPLVEIPQSISVVTADQFNVQNIQSVAQALRYSSGVLGEQRGANTDALEYVYARGFQIEEFLDGLPLPGGGIFNILSVDRYTLDRVELLHGPASVLYGQSSPGGLLNLVSKRPTLQPIREVEVQTGTFGRIQGSFDFSGAFDDGGRLLYRVTGDAYSADTQVEHKRQERYAIAPSLTWRPSMRTSVTLFGYYQNDPEGGFYNLLPAAGTVLPNAVEIPRNLDPGDPGFDQYNKESFFYGYAWDQSLGANLSFFQNVRYFHNDILFQAVFADSGVTPDGLSLVRTTFRNSGNVDAFTIDNQIRLRGQTGALMHAVTVGLDYQSTDYDHWLFGDFAPPELNILNPVYNVPIPEPTFVFATSEAITQTQLGVYAQDQIRVGNWAFLVGIRHDWTDNNTLSLKFGDETSQSDDAFSWRAGLVYLFDNGLAPYFSYSTSFEPEISTDFFGEPFEPTIGKQFEAGVKYQPPGMDSFITGSLFHITQENVSTPDPDHTFFSIQTGEVRSQGFELEGHVSLGMNTNLIAAYSYLDIQNTESDPEFLHKWPTGIPRHTASLWVDYTFAGAPMAGLQIGAGVRYVGSSYGDAANSFKVPSYTLVDAAVHYDLANLTDSLQGWQLGLTASNLLDETYVSQCVYDSGCTFGLARVVLVNLKRRW